MSKKNQIKVATDGYTGETVKHKVSAADLKNNPELAEMDIKAGDEIEIEVQSEDKVSQKGNPKRAEEIAKEFSIETVFENTETGDFFTTENLALLSAGRNKAKIKTHNF